MKDVLNFKQADIFLQAAALAIPVAMAIVRGDTGFIGYAYFTVGGMQIGSAILTRIFLDNNLRDESRGGYERMLLVIAPVTLIIWVILLADVWFFGFWGLVYLFIMALITPFLAIWYAVITIYELRKIKYQKDEIIIADTINIDEL